MEKGSGTRSGLLWEVERLLNECDELPQVLLMENVPQVHSKKNMPDFQKWIDFLDSKGYSNYWQDLNARDFGVAQNRNRCFMVSILGYQNYKFPTPITLDKTMNDYLEDTVDDRYYITSEKAKKLIDTLILNGKIPTDIQADRATIDLSINDPRIIDTANCITAHTSKDGNAIEGRKAAGNGVCEYTRLLGYLDNGSGKHESNTVYGSDELSPCICAGMGVKQQPTMTIEQQIVAMRGRNPENPSDRSTGIHTEQRLELQEDNICNCLTSVQKDSLVLETEKFVYGRNADIERLCDACKQGGQHLCKLNKMPQGKLCSLDDVEVCDIDHPVASTVTARYYKGIGSHKDNMVLETQPLSVNRVVNGEIKQDEVCIKIRQATKNGYINCKIGGWQT